MSGQQKYKVNRFMVKAYVTTSWDDGHPEDEKCLDILEKYRLRGTFYLCSGPKLMGMSTDTL